jgi:hypothetical protein
MAKMPTKENTDGSELLNNSKKEFPLKNDKFRNVYIHVEVHIHQL